ncbi:MAG TPA: gfo/Idh/MocA family oxidoreductase, partial [Saprospiraceae bacterium]|nr:gfo/Idh/MocA family oxidoreductase [Saprospiraceae bacterium]
ASQICHGEENNLNIRVYGEKGGLQWHQQEPNTLLLKVQNQATQVLRTGVGALSEAAAAHTRVPAGHPEGYLEAFANIYRNVAICILARINGQEVDPVYADFPSVDDGVRGMEFIYKVIESGKSEEKWLSM